MQPGATEKNAELIRQIKRLRDQGLLTDEQYRQQYRILTNQKKPSQRIASHRRLPLWVISAGVTAAAALILFSVTKNEPGESTSASTAEFAITTTSLAVTQTTSPQEVTPTTNLSERTAVPPQPPITYDLPTGYLVCSSKESARFMQEVLIKNGHQIVADGVCGTETDWAITEFRQELGLSPDPIVDSQFWLRTFGYPENTERQIGIKTIDSFETPGGALLPNKAVLWRSQTHQVGPDTVLEQLYVIPFYIDPSSIADWIVTAQDTAKPLGSMWEIPEWDFLLADESTDDNRGYYDHLNKGDCFDFPDNSFSTATKQSCTKPHDAQMLIASTPVPLWVAHLDRYINDEEAIRLADDICWTAADDYRPTWQDERENLFANLFLTVEEDWDYDGRYLLCAFEAWDLSPLTERIQPNSLSDQVPDPPSIVRVTDAFLLDTPEGKLTISIMDNGPGRVEIGLRLVTPST